MPPIACLGVLLLTLSCCSSTQLSTQRPLRTKQTTVGARAWDSWAPYYTASKLTPVDDGHKYTFVLLRYGMTIPTYPSFEGDPYYKDKWKNRKGEITERGVRLMHVVGESLRYRYAHLMGLSAQWRRTAWRLGEHVSITTSNSERRSIAMADALQRGFLPAWRISTGPERAKPFYQSGSGFDTNGGVQKCKYWIKLQELFNNPNSDMSLANDFSKKCSPQLYQFLATTVSARNGWAINDPMKMYKLFEMILFESAQHTHKLDWVKMQYDDLEHCVVNYFMSFFNAKDMVELYIEKILDKMKQEYKNNKLKIHMHLTDELTFMAMRYYTYNLNYWRQISQRLPVEWPKFGDALVFDFYSTKVQIKRFSRLSGGNHVNFHGSLYNTDDLFQIIGTGATATTWEAKCNQEPFLYAGWTYRASGHGGSGYQSGHLSDGYDSAGQPRGYVSGPGGLGSRRAPVPVSSFAEPGYDPHSTDYF